MFTLGVSTSAPPSTSSTSAQADLTMPLNTLHDLLVHELRDLLSAEKQLVKALPKMAKAASSDELRSAITGHLEQTRVHVTRLEQSFESLGLSARGAKCDAMAGLLEEASGLLAEEAAPEVLDAAIIGSAQRVEHYEMAAYGCARAYAERLGETDVAALLATTLEEESDANDLLNQIALASVNELAAAAGSSHE